MNGGYVIGTPPKPTYPRPKSSMNSRAGKRWRPSARRSRSRRLQVLRTRTGWRSRRLEGGRTRPGVSARRRGGRSSKGLVVYFYWFGVGARATSRGRRPWGGGTASARGSRRAQVVERATIVRFGLSSTSTPSNRRRVDGAEGCRAVAAHASTAMSVRRMLMVHG